jgi:hypothetical protein
MASPAVLEENQYVNVFKGNHMYENWMIENEYQEPETEYDNSKLKNIPVQNPIYDNWRIKNNKKNVNTDTNIDTNIVRYPQYYEHWTFTTTKNSITPITNGICMGVDMVLSDDIKNTSGLIKVKVKKYKQCNIM